MANALFGLCIAFGVFIMAAHVFPNGFTDAMPYMGSKWSFQYFLSLIKLIVGLVAVFSLFFAGLKIIAVGTAALLRLLQLFRIEGIMLTIGAVLFVIAKMILYFSV